MDFPVWDKVQLFAFSAAITSAAAFFMQRLHYQDPDAPVAWPKLLSKAARMIIWSLYLGCAYIGYKQGWLPAIICAAFVFITPIVITAGQMALIKVSPATLSLSSTPVCIISFPLALFALSQI